MFAGINVCVLAGHSISCPINVYILEIQNKGFTNHKKCLCDINAHVFDQIRNQQTLIVRKHLLVYTAVFTFQCINAQYEAAQNALDVQRKEFQAEQKQLTDDNKSLKSE